MTELGDMQLDQLLELIKSEDENDPTFLCAFWLTDDGHVIGKYDKRVTRSAMDVVGREVVAAMNRISFQVEHPRARRRHVTPVQPE